VQDCVCSLVVIRLVNCAWRYHREER